MRKFGLSNNQLKILALLTMTVDHIGAYLFPRVMFLRIIGRIAYPIFAYMIAEGCFYTRRPGRYIGSMAALAVVCQVVYFFFAGSVYMYIPVTFTLSISLIFLLKRAMENPNEKNFALFGLGVLAVLAITEFLPMLPGTDFGVDYGFFGVMLPVVVYVGKNHWQKLLLAAVMLVLLGIHYGSLQMWALLSLPLLALYNGQRGKWKMKWLFYIYYPAHLAALYLIGWIL